jgi:hypothetical protein
MIWKKLRCSHREAMRRRNFDKNMAPWKYEYLMEFLIPPAINDFEANNSIEPEESKGYEINIIQVDDSKTASDDEKHYLSVEEPQLQMDDTYNDPDPLQSELRDRRRTEVDRGRIEHRHNIYDNNRTGAFFEMKDALTDLFSSLCQKTRQLPRHLQLRVQKEIFESVNRAEEEALADEYSSSSGYLRKELLRRETPRKEVRRSVKEQTKRGAQRLIPNSYSPVPSLIPATSVTNDSPAFKTSVETVTQIEDSNVNVKPDPDDDTKPNVID